MRQLTSRHARARLRALLLLALLAALLPLATTAQAAGGTITAWGDNSFGQSSAPPGLNNAVAVAAHAYHSLALKSDGTVVGWGSNDAGQTSVPAGLTGVTAIATGFTHSLALKSNGTVVAWGCGNATLNVGQCTVPAGLTGVIALDAGDTSSMAVKSDGTVVVWGGVQAPPAGLSGVTAVAGGALHGVALKSDGTVVAWGDNTFHQLDIPPGLTGVIAISAGYLHSAALKSDGTVVVWGDDRSGQLDLPPGLTGVVAISAGRAHTLALKSDGTVVAFGCGAFNDGQCIVPAGLNGVTAVAAGLRHSLAVQPTTADTTAPVISANVTGVLGDNGWYRGDVTVSWSVTDPESAFSRNGCDPVTISADTAGTTITCSATSLGGTATQSVTIKRDTTPPSANASATPGSNGNGWNNSDVTVAWNWTDASGSGIRAASCPETSTSNGEGTFTLSAACTDLAGNNGAASSTVNVDKTPPVLTITAATADGNPYPAGTWTNQDVTLTVTCSDALSGILNPASCNFATTVNYEIVAPASLSVSDKAGNTSGVVNFGLVKIDKTAPTVTTTPERAPDANGWYNAPVTFSFSGMDSASGSGGVTCDAATTYAGPDSAAASVAGRCADAAGNVAPAAANFKYDATAPTLAPAVSPNPVQLNGSATASPNASDNLSGIAGASCTTPDTSSAGAKSVSCTATDQAGNSAAASAGYTVNGTTWSGFFPPVDNLPVVNQVKAGSAVPVKFSLGGNHGLGIFAAGYPASQQISCSTNAPIDDIEQTVTAGASSLQYDAATGQYSYIWKTDRAWAGQCRQLTVRLLDGTQQQANFRFR
jgi:hypothetical protein